jgi:hypothetical protein
VGHRSDRSHVERLGIVAIHCVSGAQQAPVEIFNLAASPADATRHGAIALNSIAPLSVTEPHASAARP